MYHCEVRPTFSLRDMYCILDSVLSLSIYIYIGESVKQNKYIQTNDRIAYIITYSSAVSLLNNFQYKNTISFGALHGNVVKFTYIDTN